MLFVKPKMLKHTPIHIHVMKKRTHTKREGALHAIYETKNGTRTGIRILVTRTGIHKDRFSYTRHKDTFDSETRQGASYTENDVYA